MDVWRGKNLNKKWDKKSLQNLGATGDGYGI